MTTANAPGLSAFAHVPVGAPHPHEVAGPVTPPHPHDLAVEGLVELRVFNALLARLLTKKPTGDIDLDKMRADERASLEPEGK